MITIIDYGLGNIKAFVNVYKRLHIPVKVAQSATELTAASKLILPGVGAFDHAMTRLNVSGMRETIDELVMAQKIPVLGICVGMQMLATGSEEGKLAGLGWVPGIVKAFDSSTQQAGLPLPHMGWNEVHPHPASGLFSGLDSSGRFYFLHSYYFSCENKDNEIASTAYGLDFSCAVSSGHIYGVQFHPEKSHHCGVTLLKNFAEL
tara:strand:+ start:476 stop:1090 length:615 start_codon:yes stop_codon:yes gene_type:complete